MFLAAHIANDYCTFKVYRSLGNEQIYVLYLSCTNIQMTVNTYRVIQKQWRESVFFHKSIFKKLFFLPIDRASFFPISMLFDEYSNKIKII